jgi:hypothetical protein
MSILSEGKKNATISKELSLSDPEFYSKILSKTFFGFIKVIWIVSR